MKAKRDIYQEVTDQMISLLETAGSDWVKNWTGSEGLPVNIASTNHYKGINIPLLGFSAGMQGFNSNTWGTYKQWAEKGGQVKKGSTGTMAVFFKTITREATATEKKSSFPMIRNFILFNHDQVEGVELPHVEQLNDHERIESAQMILDQSHATITEAGNNAFYAPSVDRITLPPLNAFDSAESFYLTAFHELTHWTAHKTRLDRAKAMQSRFGDHQYAMEELVAEMGAAFLGAHSQISPEPREDHAKYLNNWIKTLKEDKRAIFTAASKAQQATDYILELQQAKAIAA